MGLVRKLALREDGHGKTETRHEQEEGGASWAWKRGDATNPPRGYHNNKKERKLLDYCRLW
jgi:hypothetical protein